jgi:hypothetical protein
LNTYAGVLMAPVVVLVRDAYSNPVSGVPVTVQLVGGIGFGPWMATTDANGKATFSTLKITTPGKYQLKATSAGLPIVLSNWFNIWAR